VKLTRSRAREAAFQILYRFDLEGANPELAGLEGAVKSHLDHWSFEADTHEFARNLSYGTLREIQKIDELLTKESTNWKLSRMASVDRTLLRLAVYEILFCSDIPASVTMDEYIELAKTFGSAETAGFVNGILDSIAKSHPKSV